ncbi:uncharacterized protein [Nicotiana sylvestris]|uniref:uncharacterized protein n=1 Tax=Nicotiana sylvestris TaxID=4096 RepID=UPI00388C820A
MLARKVVIEGEQIKKINEQLKASQADEPYKSLDSFKSAGKGKETVSSEIEQRLLPQEEELQGVKRCRVRLKLKDLKESKIKNIAKGNKKMVEPVEVVEIEEMELVFHDKEDAEEVEDVTPKAKKIKTSKKKSPSKTKSAKPSTLARRTRFAIKSRKVKVVEEEESEEEE